MSQRPLQVVMDPLRTTAVVRSSLKVRIQCDQSKDRLICAEDLNILHFRGF